MQQQKGEKKKKLVFLVRFIRRTDTKQVINVKNIPPKVPNFAGSVCLIDS